MSKTRNDVLDYQNYVFDLDNTLYNENLYLFPIYERIGFIVSKKYGVDKVQVFNYLKGEFLRSGRTRLFDRMINYFNLELSDMDSFLMILRTHQLEKKMELYEKMRNILKELNRITSDIFIVTNGNVEQQKNKICQIQWGNVLFKEVVFANEYKPKPSNEALEYLIDKYNMNRQKSLFIGDAKSDEICALSSDVDFYHVGNFLND